MKKSQLLIAALLAAGSVGAYAGDSWYLDAALGQTKADLGDTSGWTNVDDKDSSYSIGLGLKINESISVEGGYTDLGKASMSTSGQ